METSKILFLLKQISQLFLEQDSQIASIETSEISFHLMGFFIIIFHSLCKKQNFCFNGNTNKNVSIETKKNQFHNSQFL